LVVRKGYLWLVIVVIGRPIMVLVSVESVADFLGCKGVTVVGIKVFYVDTVPVVA
jgi:hypothetical protein